jgi:IS5 family transposase
MRWDVPEELSEAEQKFVLRLRRGGKFFIFLREIRPRLFDESFQAELEKAYGKPRGTHPLPPALLAMVTLLQAYQKTSDSEAVEQGTADLRWQLPLGCLGAEKAPFSQGVLSQFRERMAEYGLDKKLLERTVQLARETGKFGWQTLKFALDSSPLLGAGRVEDTWNLIGRALSTVVDCAAKSLRVRREQVLREAKLTLLSGPSLKAALDIDWDDDEEKAAALQRLLAEADALQAWVQQHAGREAEKPALQKALAALRLVLEQDLEPDPNGGGGRLIRRGVTKDRMPSLGDKEMRHGRKSKSRVFNGYKRHIATLAGKGLIVAATALPANHPEYEAMAPLLDEAEKYGPTDVALIDRGYLASPRVEQLLKAGKDVQCKPWPSRNHGRFTKENFAIDLQRGRLTCPAGARANISAESLMAHFAARTCDPCRLRTGCTAAQQGRGRSVTIHPQEELLIELRRRRRTSEGRAALRERVHVEHALARLSAVQGPRARYKGIRKNTLDVRRCAAIVNLQAIARATRPQLQQVA